MSKVKDATAVAPKVSPKVVLEVNAKKMFLAEKLIQAEKMYAKKLISDAEREAKKGLPKVEMPRQLSGKIAEKVEKIANFDGKNAGSWDKLRHVSNLVTVDAMGLNKALKNYLDIAKQGELTASQLKCINFANCKAFISTSIKYKGLALFTTNDITLIVNKVLVLNDKNTARALKVKKQGGTVGKKADKLTVNSAK